MTLSGMRSHRKARVCPASMSEAQFAVPRNTCRFLCAGPGVRSVTQLHHSCNLQCHDCHVSGFAVVMIKNRKKKRSWSQNRRIQTDRGQDSMCLQQLTDAPNLILLWSIHACVYTHMSMCAHTHSCQRNAPKMLTSDKHASVLSPACQLLICPWQSITFWGVCLWMP